MIEICCECNWDIQGIENLPSHVHRSYATVKGPRNGQILKVNAHDARLNPDWEVIDEWDEVLFSIDWKRMAKTP